MSHRGFTLIELLVVILIIAGLMAILLPFLSSARRQARVTENATKLRGVHQACVTFSQGNRAWYPGIASSGTISDSSTTGRFRVLLDGGYLSGAAIVSPLDDDATAWRTGAVVLGNYSYALPTIEPPANARFNAWRDTVDPETIASGDEPETEWRGGLVWNDGHTSVETITTVETRYDGISIDADDVFVDEPVLLGGNALLGVSP